METVDKILFYSHNNQYGYMSNFHKSNFTDDNITYMCNEQYFMKKKQELFDSNNLDLANDIIQSINPSEIKKFGRQVKNYNNLVWDNTRYEIMKHGLRLKFNQNPIIKQKLINTNPKKLYEASPYDKIWGTGYDAENTLRLINENSQDKLGQNLLGKALEEIRQELTS